MGISRSMKKLLSFSVLGLGAFLFQSGTAEAQTSVPADLDVQAIVQDACIITTTSVNFGFYDVTDTNPNDADGAVTVTCTLGLAWEVLLGQGLHTGAGSTDADPVRRLASGANILTYSLFADAGRTVEWQNATGGGVSGSGTGAAQNIPVYGRLDELQNVPAGTYTDTVVATVNY
jgi:spore coat protein U-like protein